MTTTLSKAQTERKSNNCFSEVQCLLSPALTLLTKRLSNVVKQSLLTWPDFLAFSSILMRLALRSSWSGVPLVRGGPAPTEAGRPMEAEDGDRELVGVRLRLGKLGGPGGA